MAAYIIVSYDITDPARYEDYIAGLMPLLDQHRVEILVLDFDAKPLEGERSGVHAVLRFASEAAALAFYYDPAFEPLKKLRLDSCENLNIVLAAPQAQDAEARMRTDP